MDKAVIDADTAKAEPRSKRRHMVGWHTIDLNIDGPPSQVKGVSSRIDALAP
jgi:hypothetical protein